MVGGNNSYFNNLLIKLGGLDKTTALPSSKRNQESAWNLFVKEFCNNTSLHAISQVAKPIYRPHEKLLWTVLFILGVLGASFTCIKTWARYTESTTSTVIETTRYSYANVPFPSVTVCDKSRVDWARALELSPEEIPEPFAENKAKMLAILKRLAFASFGDFDFFNQLRLENNTDLSDLNQVNITKILLKVMRPCDEMFFEWCWFRDLEYDCCSIFELQRTEYGFCWSFNSDTSEPSRGFKVIALPEDRLPPEGNHTTTGFYVGVADSKSELHNIFLQVAPGLEVRLPIWGEALIATEDVRDLKYSARNCLFPEEDLYGLPQGFYLAANCRVACYQNYTLHYCNCSPDYIFLDRGYDGTVFKPCNVEGLLCLSEYNDIFTYEVPPIKSEFFPSTKPGINCTCPSDCQSQLYVTEMSTPSKGNISTTTEVDVHFRLPECIRYKTDVVYQWLDAVVSFGGIAGLFLGASLLSAVEILYFCTVRFIIVWHQARRRAETNSKKKVYPFLH